MLEESKAFATSLTKPILVWIVLAVVVFSLGISVFVFNLIKEDLIPPEVELVVTNPLSAFVSQIELSLLVSFIFSFPYFIYSIFHYLSPALFEREKKGVLISILPILVLFIFGVLFGYYVLIPNTFSVLFPYAGAIGARQLFVLDEFMSLVMSLVLATGVMFLTPMFMLLASYVGLVGRRFWQEKWRHATLVLLCFSAIITPDGTGITMVILSVPLVLLYWLGVFISNKY
jgi:sec-independent protein translocase protein TatC